jgi:hypothetical protein
MKQQNNTLPHLHDGHRKASNSFFGRYFEVKERGSSVFQELRAGVVGFLTVGGFLGWACVRATQRSSVLPAHDHVAGCPMCVFAGCHRFVWRGFSAVITTVTAVHKK